MTGGPSVDHAAVASPGSTAALTARVCAWLAVGPGVTAAAALVLDLRPDLRAALLSSPALWALWCGPAVAGVTLRGRVPRMAPLGALAALGGFAALMGAALGPVYWRYTGGSLAGPSAAAAATLATMAAIGRVSRRDVVSRWGLATTALVGALWATAVSAASGGRHGWVGRWLAADAGVAVVTALVGLDADRVRRLAEGDTAGGERAVRAAAIRGAAMVYLDFVNLFVLAARAAERWWRRARPGPP